METAQMNKVNVQTPSLQVSQSGTPKDTVADVGSFQDTLKDLNLTENKKSQNTDVKTDVQSNVQNTVEQLETDQLQQNKNNVQNSTKNMLVDNQNVLILQSENVNSIGIDSFENPENQIFNPVNEKILNLPNDAQNIPPVNQAVQELTVLHQIINESKECKDLKEQKGLIKMGHISKDINPLENDLKLLDESLKSVSDNNLNNVDKVVENIVNDKVNIQNSIINDIETKSFENKMALDSISELNSKISAINSINSVSEKIKTPLGSIKINKEDANFFVNMVENQNNNVFQANVTINANNQVTFADVKAQAAQSSAAVSQALIEKLQESMNTNKAFRVDFDNNVAVIMRVDSNGVLSANFIPGSSAVEQYLRNNIAELRQTFENKGLEYNELSYSSKKQNQNRQQQRNNRGGKDE